MIGQGVIVVDSFGVTEKNFRVLTGSNDLCAHFRYTCDQAQEMH
jgi:hypothetical protein